MATPMNFQSLNYGGIAQQEQDARRRYYDSLSSIGGVIKDTGKEYEDYLARKKAEEDEKRKWDNMIAEQEYRKQQAELARKYQEQRDLVADTRYDNEYAIKQNERMLQEGSLKNMKAEYGNMDTKGMTPEEIGFIKTIANAPTYADAINAQDGLNQYRYQTKILQMQQEQNERSARQEERAARQEEQAKIAENMFNDVAARENASKFNYNVNAKLPPKEVLPAYRDEIQQNLDYLLSNPTPSLNKNAKIREYKTLLDAINNKLNYKPKKSTVDRMLGY